MLGFGSQVKGSMLIVLIAGCNEMREELTIILGLTHSMPRTFFFPIYLFIYLRIQAFNSRLRSDVFLKLFHKEGFEYSWSNL